MGQYRNLLQVLLVQEEAVAPTPPEVAPLVFELVEERERPSPNPP
jgi:hypothetical protein